MYLQKEMSHLEFAFRFGFLSDRLVEAIAKYEKEGKTIGKEVKAVFTEGVGFFDMVLKGKEQVTTGVYGSNPLESLMTYNRSLSIILDMPNIAEQMDANKIKVIFEEFKQNLERMAAGEQVNLVEVAKTKDFFNCLRESTLSDSSDIINGLDDSRRMDRWELHPETW
ncbi:MAG: hypothetical protein ACQCN4_12450 [Candidatus Bathyarchaeia archaeon]|jgi:hypothetical protein